MLKEVDRIGNLTVIYVPGHSPGSIALFDEQRKILFAGDTLRFDGSKVTGAPKQFAWDTAKEKKSIEKSKSENPRE